MVADASQSKDWINGSGKVLQYLISATLRNQPNMPILRLLVEKYGAELDVKAKVWNCIWGNDHYGALHLLARGQNWWQHEAVKSLLEKGANPDLQDDVGRTLLRLAVLSLINGAPMSKDIIKSLLENGANPNLADEKGLTPLNEKINDPEVVLEDGQDCNVRLSIKSSPIYSPFGQGPVSNEQFPLEFAIRFPWGNDSGTSAAIIKLLLEHGANSLQPSSYNQRSLILHEFIRYSRDLEECQPLLNQSRLDINVRDDYGDTPFLVACQQCQCSLG
jgi:ankyrin repeat protein